jgi:[lysine-biosynthesis-protein LysW]---L-2-aminoadipate ligase
VGAIYRCATADSLGTADWRTNVARGSRAEPCPLSPELGSICQAAASAITGGRPDGTVLGVDLVEDRAGALYVLEVNHTVEFRGFQQAHASASTSVAEVIVAEVRRVLEGVSCTL